MEAIKIDAKLLHEFEHHADANLRHLDRIGSILPGADGTPRTERVAPQSPHGVPIGDGKTKVVAHRLPFDFLIRVVVPK
jgi:hypothetical protein